MKGEGNDAVYIALYVDDFFLMGKNIERIKEVKDGLCTQFKMKDLGEARFLLGVEIRRQVNGGFWYKSDTLGMLSSASTWRGASPC